MSKHHQVLIIGGGTGGIMTAAQLLNHKSDMDVAIIEPGDTHYYQPAWTLVGAGTYDMSKTARPMSSVMPKGATWIKDKATTFDPEKNTVNTEQNGAITYDYLVVSPGLQMDLDGIEGLREALETDAVCSNYIDPEKTWRIIKNFKGGNALFTQPSTPIKCGGAPQKIMYLADDHFRRAGVREKSEVIFATPGSVIFGVKPFKETLEGVIRRKSIHLKTFYNPVKIDSKKKEVHFRYMKQEEGGCVLNEDSNQIGEHLEGDMTFVVPYEMLHLAPPQSAPDFIKKSPLAHSEGPSRGWLNVDINSLQHKVYKNVFGLGDVAALPTAKTGAAIRKQAPVVVGNIIHLMKDGKLDNSIYEGYSSCPLVTGYGKMVLAEFKYDSVRDSDPFLSKFVDTSKEKWSMWVLKKYGLPYLYWNKMMKGKM